MKSLGHIACLLAVLGLALGTWGSGATLPAAAGEIDCAHHEPGPSPQDPHTPKDPQHHHCGGTCSHVFTAISVLTPGFRAPQPDLIQMLLLTGKNGSEGFSSRLFIPPRLS